MWSKQATCLIWSGQITAEWAWASHLTVRRLGSPAIERKERGSMCCSEVPKNVVQHLSSSELQHWQHVGDCLLGVQTMFIFFPKFPNHENHPLGHSQAWVPSSLYLWLDPWFWSGHWLLMHNVEINSLMSVKCGHMPQNTQQSTQHIIGSSWSTCELLLCGPRSAWLSPPFSFRS